MSIPGAASPLFLGAAVAEEAAYQIDRSLRFNSGDTSYLNRTPSSASNRRTWTWSAWVKRSGIGANDDIFKVSGSATKATQFRIQIHNGDYVSIDYGGAFYLKTTRLLRDPSAWMHLVVAVDTTTSTADNRIRLYINGSEETSFDTRNNPNQDEELAINTTSAHTISTADSNGLDGYLADVHFIDGQALAPTDFGQYDSNNVWQPKDASGLTFGTNGFHLDFSDTSDLGADAAGSNDWTPNNLVGSAPGLSTANQGFDAVTYSGNGSTQSISGLNFQPDFVWLKETGPRNNVSHQLYDVVRGTSKMLQSDNTGAEATISGVTGFTSNGFNLGSNGGGNNSGSNYVAWCWKAGGSASSNTNGTITSSVSANTTYGFSIVSYSGTSNTTDTVGHGLPSAPKVIIIKQRNGTSVWPVYHDSLGTNIGGMILDGTTAAASGTSGVFPTAPTSSVYTIGNDIHQNGSGKTYIAYCWSEVSGFSKFGSYSGNGQTLGPTVTTGFKPRLVAIRRTDSAGNWEVYDSARSLDKDLKWNTHEAEGTAPIIFNSDGFQTNYATGSLNASGGNYIYMAFASKPDQSAIDSLIDTPTNYEADSGNNGGNYATLNPLSKGSLITLANGNLDISAGTGSGSQRVWGTIGVSTGKWYFEFTQSSGTYAQAVGIKSSAAQDNSTQYGYHGNTGNKIDASGSTSSYGATWGNNDVIGVAFDLDAGTITFYKNGVSQGQAFSGITDATYFPYVFGWSGGAWGGFVNFGARPFAYTPPSNHLALVTTNLTDPTIADGSTAMDVALWTGTGATRSITGLGFSPDFVWIKKRSGTTAHNLFDIVRGANKPLFSNLTNAELSDGRLTAFNSDGFTLDSDNAVNDNNETHVGWAWDGGTTTATNTDGSITSNVRANQSAGFSIVTWTGQSSGSATIGHGLNAAPELIILKGRTGSVGWTVGHQSIGWTKRLQLNTAAAQSTSSNYWNDTAPTNSVFTSGANNVSNTFVAYCFAPVAGYSAFGSYTGTGSSDGPFVFTGMRPAFVLLKLATNGSARWFIFDSTRDTYNAATASLYPDRSDAEGSSHPIDFLSNGFKLREADSAGYTNYSGSTYVWAAFSEHPFSTARAR